MLQDLQNFYEKEGRHNLSWRQPSPRLRHGKPNFDPYKIVVSELMLQQTQVDRVLPKYTEFLKVFPNFEALSKAPLSKVLLHWQGLGYNRRAKFLHQTAKVVVQEYGGTLPQDPAELEKLPGIGSYTARAVAAFAFNQPVVFIETNIRTVYLLRGDFFPKKSLPTGRQARAQTVLSSKSLLNKVSHKSPLRRISDVDLLPSSKISDAELLPLIEKDLKHSKMEPREFYWALMDYGAYLKRQGVKLNQHSKHYTRQSKFEGSARQLRGAIIKDLLVSPTTAAQLQKRSGRTLLEVKKVLGQLQQEGLVVQQGLRFAVSK